MAGDPRRWADLSFDLAIVVPAARPRRSARRVRPATGQIVTVVNQAERRRWVTMKGVPVTLSIPEPTGFGTELVRRTGAPAYVDALEPLPEAADERDVYAEVGIPWCPPELREAPFTGEPPRLVEQDDVRGDLHCHTTWSDGGDSVLEMATAARDLGYEYLAICDHTPNVQYSSGPRRRRAAPTGRGDPGGQRPP